MRLSASVTFVLRQGNLPAFAGRKHVRRRVQVAQIRRPVTNCVYFVLLFHQLFLRLFFIRLFFSFFMQWKLMCCFSYALHCPRSGSATVDESAASIHAHLPAQVDVVEQQLPHVGGRPFPRLHLGEQLGQCQGQVRDGHSPVRPPPGQKASPNSSPCVCVLQIEARPGCRTRRRSSQSSASLGPCQACAGKT